MASVIGALGQSSLASQTDLHLFDTGKKTREGRSFLEGMSARLRLMRDWNRALLDHRPHIAHIHTCSGLTFFLDGLLLMLACRQGCKVVMHVHGARFDEFLDGLDRLRSAGARYIARRADTLIALSDDWRHRLEQRLPGSHIQVLANGVPDLGGAVERQPAEIPVFVFLGNLCKRKGVPVLLEAAERAQTPWTLVLAGGDEEPGFSEWTRLEIGRRQLQNRVRVLGPVVGGAKIELLCRADAFVLPSLAEGLPMALLEAMAAGLPVVVTQVGAMPEVITDQSTGLLVPPGDATALASAMDQLAQSSHLRSMLGEAAQSLYRSRYSVDAMAHHLMGIYASLDESGLRNTPAPATRT